MRALRNCDFCADDAVGTFEIVPPELEPTEAEQRRVVCCPDCRDRLEALLEPLLARAGAETAVEIDDEVAADVLETTDDELTDDESTADGSSLAAGDELTSAENEPNTAASREEGITFERDERPTDTETADDAEMANEDSPSASTRPPATYRKVIRLLRNREFPMTRSAVEELAAGAYDLERHEAEAVVDHAVENGEFVEEQGTLRRP